MKTCILYVVKVTEIVDFQFSNWHLRYSVYGHSLQSEGKQTSHILSVSCMHDSKFFLCILLLLLLVHFVHVHQCAVNSLLCNFVSFDSLFLQIMKTSALWNIIFIMN